MASTTAAKFRVSTTSKRSSPQKTTDETPRHGNRIQRRLDDLERSRKGLPPQERWPTVKRVEAYKKQTLKEQAKAKAAFEAAAASPCVVVTEGAKSSNSSEMSREHMENDTDRPMGPSRSPSFPISTRRQHLTSFPLFPLLPTELRIQIWEEMLRTPKLIEVQYSTEFYEPTLVNKPNLNPLRSVCKESREVASAYKSQDSDRAALYMRQFPGFKFARPYMTFTERQRQNQAGIRPQPHYNPRIISTPSHDTIFLRSLDVNASSSLAWSLHGLEHIQHLALPLDRTSLHLTTTWEWNNFLSRMTSLKSLTLLVGSKEKGWEEGGRVELRPLECWFMDGREKWLGSEGNLPTEAHLDITQVGTWLKAPNQRWLDVAWACGRRALDRPVSVRVLAWKRVIGAG